MIYFEQVDLDAVESRYRAALDLLPPDGADDGHPYIIDWASIPWIESARDVPALIAEIRQLRALDEWERG